MLSNGYPPEDEASDDDEDDVALEMGPSPDLREQFLPENIFQGKDVAHLMEQIGNMEKEQGNNEENDNTSSESRRRIHRPAFGDVDLLRNLAPSTQSSYNAALANGAEKVHSSQDTHGQTGDPNDMELEQLLRDNDSLTGKCAVTEDIWSPFLNMILNSDIRLTTALCNGWGLLKPDRFASVK